LTASRPIKPTSPRCHSAWQPNPGRGSTYRRGNSVQTTGTTSLVNLNENALSDDDSRQHNKANFTGSLPITKTIGIVVVAALPARAGSSPPVVAINAGSRPISSSTIAGSHSEPKRTSGRSRSFPSTLVLLRPPIHFRRPAVLSSPRQLRCAAAVIAREAYWVVEHGDNHCSRENGGAEHKGNYKGMGPSRRGRCRPGVGRFLRSTHSPPAAPHRASRLLPWSCWAPSKRGAPLLGSRSRRCNCPASPRSAWGAFWEARIGPRVRVR
jgi:hypothetical protein